MPSVNWWWTEAPSTHPPFALAHSPFLLGFMYLNSIGP